jgi:ribonuclease HI
MNTPNLSGVSVLVDGGCRNNNRPVSERNMYGSFTVFNGGTQVASTWEDKQELIHRRTYDCPHTKQDASANVSNNQAELEVLLEALEYVDELNGRLKEAGKEPLVVTILSDSEFALGMASKAMKLKSTSHQDLRVTIGLIHSMIDNVPNVKVVFQQVDNLWVKSVLGH